MVNLDVSAVGLEEAMAREWLAVNGLGGYAASSIISLNTRKYHGLLVAAMASPVRRMVILSRVEETVIHGGAACPLAVNEYPGTIHPRGHQLLRAFDTHPYPRWAYQADGWTVEKSLRLLEGESTVCLSYTLLGAQRPIEFQLRPLFALRGIHELMYQWNGRLRAEAHGDDQWRIPATARTPEAFFAHDGRFHSDAYWYLATIYRREQQRGYGGLEDLWMPGVAHWTLSPGQTAHFICSTEPIDLPETLRRLADEDARSDRSGRGGVSADPVLDDLLRAAGQFVVRPPRKGGAGSQAGGVRIFGGFPWAAPDIRKALIAFGGVMLVRGDFDSARTLIEGLLGHVRNGLLPSEFPEDGGTPIYRGADVSLWMINAVWQYLCYTRDDASVRRWLASLVRIIQAHQSGTDLGIRIDEDGLLSSHLPGSPTTWMDAKAAEWAITPRYGRPVELNALWHNAVSIVARLADRYGERSTGVELAMLARRIHVGFNRRFWNEQTGCCYDVVDDRGADGAIRPNQLLAVSLPFCVLSLDRHAAVLDRIREQLLTPFGLRTLSPRDPAYEGRYAGNALLRDRAAHQGTAYPWLLGSLCSANLRVHGRGEKARREARVFLEGCLRHLRAEGLGQLPELFDGNVPHAPGGEIADAASVAEVLRAYVEDALDRLPPPLPSISSSGADSPLLEPPSPALP